MALKDWEKIENTDYIQSWKKANTNRYLYLNEQVDGSIIARYGIWETKEVKNIPVKGIKENYLKGKKKFKSWGASLKFAKEYMQKY